MSQLNTSQKNYRPLPTALTVRPSKIDGLGLFAEIDIASGVYCGIIRVEVDSLDTPVRTPLGGFLNHSDVPNVSVVRWTHTPGVMFVGVETTKHISKGEELLLKYSLYSPEEQ